LTFPEKSGIVKEVKNDGGIMNKFSEWFGDNWPTVVFGTLFIIGGYGIYSKTVGHQIEVTQISQENPGCIYLESSRLGSGQHYMICGGQITLVRTKGDADPEEVSQAAVENAITPDANASAPATK